MNNKKNILLMITLYIYFFIITYFAIANYDVIWNYGFSYNVAKGLKLYNDFNMVITPLYPIIFGIILKIFGCNIIIFYLFNALIPVTMFYLIHKFYKNALLEVVILTAIVSGPNYNLLCLLLLFILMIMEDKKKNDYLIGIILGLIFLTKSSMGLLSLASLYYIKDFKKIIKRIIGFLLPNIIILIYFIKEKIIINYLNYAFGSLISFGKDNLNYSIGILITISIIIYLVHIYHKKKDIKILYIIFFQIISYPIFNGVHIIYSIIPAVFYIVTNNKNTIYLKYRKYLSIALLAPLCLTIIQLTTIDMDYGSNALKNKLIETRYINGANSIKNSITNLDNTYFIMYEAYYDKLLLGLKINQYDLILRGNLGYDGENKVIKYFDSLPPNTQFIIHKEYGGGHLSKKVYNHIKKNYQLYKSFSIYEVYLK